MLKRICFPQSMMVTTALVTILISSCSLLQIGKQNLFDSLLGTWRNTESSDGSVHTEFWERTNDSTLTGYGLLLNGSDTLFHEGLSIKKVDSNWYYVADVPENPVPVYFKLDSISSSGFVATNPMHDFPKKIKYQYNKTELVASVSGEGNALTFIFSKVK